MSKEVILKFYQNKDNNPDLTLTSLKYLRGYTLCSTLAAIDPIAHTYLRIRGSPIVIYKDKTRSNHIKILQDILKDYPEVSPKDVLLTMPEVFTNPL